jgi:SNF2 family DNA or RNA helicase
MIDFELMKHQDIAIARARQITNLFLAWDMGTGKSCATIQMIRERCREIGRLKRILILAPKVVLNNWKKEFSLFSNIETSSITVLTGAIKDRIEFIQGLKQYSGIVVTNYEAFQNDAFLMACRSWKPEILVCDESHVLKSYKSKRARNISLIADDCQYKYLLTGTPILNNAMDLYQQYLILDGGRTFGRNYFAFRSKYFMDKNASWSSKAGHFPEWIPKPGAYDNLMKQISACTLRVEKKDCLDLPPYIVQELEVELGPEQRRAYEAMKKFFIAYVNEEACVAQLAITKALRLQQIVSGFAKLDSGEVVRFPNNPRLEALRDTLESLAPNHKVIVWACFKENYKMIKEVCDELNIKSVELHGEVNDRDKKEAIRSFEEDLSVRVLIGNQGAGGVGINLVSATYSIYYSRGFKLGEDLQSEARNYRRGSEIHDKITRINLRANNSIDSLIADALSNKQDISNQILDYVKQKGEQYGFRSSK